MIYLIWQTRNGCQFDGACPWLGDAPGLVFGDYESILQSIYFFIVFNFWLGEKLFLVINLSRNDYEIDRRKFIGCEYHPFTLRYLNVIK